MPKLSIITINYNNFEGLKRTVESVVNQNWQEFEYLVIDGGSADSSAAYIESQSEHIDYRVTEPDSGIYNAMNKGINKASGEIMAWINSDDLYHYNSFFSVAEIFAQFEQVNWLQVIPTVFDEKGRTVHVGLLKRWRKLDYYLGNYKWIQKESIFWRRSLWKM